MGRNADYGYARDQNVFHDNSPCSDSDIICDTNPAENLGILPNVYIVPDDRRVIWISAVTTDAAIAVDDTPFPDTGLWIDNNGTEMLQMQIFAEAAGADNEA